MNIYKFDFDFKENIAFVSSYLIIFREITAIYFENQMKRVSTFWLGDNEFLKVKTGAIHSYHYVVKWRVMSSGL
jgi:hypothetical protein